MAKISNLPLRVDAVEKPLGFQVRMLAQEFARIEAAGGVILLICAIIALVWANSSLSETYFHFWESEFTIGFGEAAISLPLIEWINDGGLENGASGRCW